MSGECESAARRSAARHGSAGLRRSAAASRVAAVVLVATVLAATLLAGRAAQAAAAAPKKPAAPAPSAGATPEHQTYGRFGQVSIYRHGASPTGVVVLLSDEAGWNAEAEELARGLEAQGALVIGLDVPFYERRSEQLTEDCSYPAGDFEMLSKLVQKKLELPAYTPPVVAGFGTGATLAYGALAQAPSGTFAGAVSLGFCPELAASHPLCTGRGLSSKALPAGAGYQLQPVASLDQPWLLAPAPAAQTRCGGAAAEAFAGKIKRAAVIEPPKGNAKHQAAADLRAASGLKQAYLRVLNDADLSRVPETPVRKALADLPLLELPVPGSTGDTMAVIVSGDGGWAGLDRDVAKILADRGVPVVGLNSLQYFWKPRTPEGAAADLARILRTYLPAWNRKDALLIGYSLGAEVLPFMTNRLPPDQLAKVRMLALLGPTRTTSFEFRLSEWLGHGGGENRPVMPETVKLKGKPMVCIAGAGERATSLCSIFSALGPTVEMPGAHYLGSNPRAVTLAILRQLAKSGPAQPLPAPAAAAAPQPGTGSPAAGAATPPAGATPSPAAAAPAADSGDKDKDKKAPAPVPPPPVRWLGLGFGWAPPAEHRAGAGAPAAGPGHAPAAEEAMQYGRFGTLHLVRQSDHPANVVLLLSGDGGWDATAAAMARAFAARGYLAVGIDTAHYLARLAAQHDGCAYTAGSLENLSKVVQKRLGYPSYVYPLVAGYAGGGALAYGALAQAPAKTFRGAVSLAFCSDLPGAVQLCPAHALVTRPGPKGGLQLAPAAGLEQPWLALQGAADRRCPAGAAADFARAVPGGEVLTLAGVDHAFSRPELWQAGLDKAIDRLAAPPATVIPAAAGTAEVAETAGSKALPDLPLIEMTPSPGGVGGGGGAGAAEAAAGAPLVVMLSGDGGWASVERDVAKLLAGRHGMPVVGVDCLQLFWNGRTPEAAAAALQRVLRHYLAAWKRDQAVLVGYSLGADVLPFMASRLPADLLDRVRLMVLLGPSHTTPFDIRLREDRSSEVPVLPEVRKLRGRRLLCIGGRGEADSLCPEIGAGLGKSVELEGAHALGGDAAKLVDQILQDLQAPAVAHPPGRRR
jgi:type IV secretory pathway VirJ component